MFFRSNGDQDNRNISILNNYNSNLNNNDKQLIYKTFIFLFYYDKNLLEKGINYFSSNDKYYLSTVESITTFKNYYKYQKLYDSLERNQDINYDNLDSHIEELTKKYINSNMINSDKPKFFQKLNIKYKPEKPSYIFDSKILNILGNNSLKELNIFKKEENKYIFLNQDNQIIVGEINQKMIFEPKYMINYNSNIKLWREKNMLLEMPINEYINKRSCIENEPNKQILKDNRDILGDLIFLTKIKIKRNNNQKDSYEQKIKNKKNIKNIDINANYLGDKSNYDQINYNINSNQNNCFTENRMNQKRKVYHKKNITLNKNNFKIKENNNFNEYTETNNFEKEQNKNCIKSKIKQHFFSESNYEQIIKNNINHKEKEYRRNFENKNEKEKVKNLENKYKNEPKDKIINLENKIKYDQNKKAKSPEKSLFNKKNNIKKNECLNNNIENHNYLKKNKSQYYLGINKKNKKEDYQKNKIKINKDNNIFFNSLQNIQFNNDENNQNKNEVRENNIIHNNNQKLLSPKKLNLKQEQELLNYQLKQKSKLKQKQEFLNNKLKQEQEFLNKKKFQQEQDILNNKFKQEQDILNKKLKKEPLILYNEPTLIGLNNIGATCFMNATLQCLSQTAKLTNYFLSEENKNKIFNNNISIENKNDYQLSPAYYELINNLWDKNSPKSFSPNNFMNLINKMNPLFKRGEPGDSKDFIIFLLEQFHRELKKPVIYEKNKTNPLSPLNQYDKKNAFNHFFSEFQKETSIISDIFFGFIETTNECQYCKYFFNSQGQMNPICYNYQIFNCLIFPLEEVKKMKNNCFPMNVNVVTLEECFIYNQKSDLFTGANRHYCNICKQLFDSVYCNKIFVSPDILVLILNRGKGNIYDVKLIFYETLDLTQFALQRELDKITYNLYGVITHIGKSGPNAHFVASCKSPINNKWYRYNDAIVTPIMNIQKEIIDFGVPYILFYQKNK